MGTPVPPDWPELEDGKWYCVTEDAYTGIPGKTGCQGAIIGRTSCCCQGAPIKAYLDGGNECHWFVFLCIGHWPSPKKVIGITGPYNSKAECEGAC